MVDVNRLKSRMVLKGFTQRQLVREMNNRGIKTSENTFSSKMNGRSKFDCADADVICDILDIENPPNHPISGIMFVENRQKENVTKIHKPREHYSHKEGQRHDHFQTQRQDGAFLRDQRPGRAVSRQRPGRLQSAGHAREQGIHSERL